MFCILSNLHTFTYFTVVADMDKEPSVRFELFMRPIDDTASLENMDR